MLLYSFVLSLLLSNNLIEGRTVRQLPSEKSLSAVNNEFTFKIFQMLSNENNNDVMSPFSIQSAFSILMNGAHNQTLDDMRRFLELENPDHSVSELTLNKEFESSIQKYKNISQLQSVSYGMDGLGSNPAKLNLANLLVHNQSIELLPEYKRVIQKYFNADIRSADFKNNALEETRKVNQWVCNATNCKIQKIFDEIKNDTTFIILNALHFQGQWYNTFDYELTQKLDFYNNGVSAVKTDIMFNEARYNYYDSNELDAQLLEMEYYGQGWSPSNFTFVVVLPKQRNGLNQLKTRINAQNFNNSLESMRSQQVQLYLPKFNVESEYDLMRDIPSRPLFLSPSAQFSRLTSTRNIIGEVKHKVVIKVNEKGTEAAAVTAIRGLPGAAPPPQTIEFKADHPFLYFIRDRSDGMILFVGQLNRF